MSQSLRLITLLIIILLISTAGEVFAADPWWTQNYESEEQRVEIEYSYDKNGSRVEKEVVREGGDIKFTDATPWTLDQFSEEEQSIYLKLVAIKTAEPNLGEAELIARLVEVFGNEKRETSVNLLGFYQYETATESYTYLNEGLSEQEIQIYDTRFSIYESQYPKPPKTAEGLLKIEREVLVLLADQFESSPRKLQKIIGKAELYMDKHTLPRDQKLSESLKAKKK